jgi:predicted Zn-dependent protease
MGFYDNGYNRPTFHLTWLIALVIAMFGVFRYFTTTQVNPVTGEKQRVNMTPAQEVALGMQSAPAMAQQMGGEMPASDPRTQLVNRIGRQIVDRLDLLNDPWQFQFHLLRDPKTVNAFALPGGQIFITMGLLTRLQNTAELAGVLGHEMGHVIERHSAQQLAKQQLGQTLGVAAWVGASNGNNREQAAAAAAQVANQMIQLHYSRDNESEADGRGVLYMTRAGYDPRQMIEVMRILKEVSGSGGGPEFLATHPDPGNRAEAIGGQIRQMFPQGVPPNLTTGDPLTSGGGSGKW